MECCSVLFSLKFKNNGIKNKSHQIETIRKDTLIASACEAKPKELGYMLIKAFNKNNAPPPK